MPDLDSGTLSDWHRELGYESLCSKLLAET